MNPIQVTFRDLPYSQAVENDVYGYAEKLKLYFDRMIACSVVLTISQNHKHQGKLYNVRINVSAPGKEIVVTRQEDEDLHVAIRDAFNALTRQVDEYIRVRRGDVKSHDLPLHGFVVRLFLDEGFGFINGQDGNEYYFSITNVASTTIDHLAVGDAVQFLAEPSNDGLQARRVTVLRHNHIES